MPVSISDPANGKTKLEILNTNDYERKTIYIIIFLLVTISGKAQDFNPGPEAQNLTERKNVTVDYATGLFHYTVPLYQLKSGDYELPISLDYIAKGVKVSDPEGLIGQNWTLNVGGIVTRTMRGGFADEKSGYGYLWTENAVTPLEQDARTVGLRKRDGESDIFTVVFNGKKVDFIIRMNEKRQIYALPLGQTDVRIECEGTSTEITGWTITDNNGDRYIYRQREICADVEYVDVSTSNAISDSGYTSAWHLTRILPYNGAPIDFCYKGDVMDLDFGNLSLDSIHTMKIYDSYKMIYHYGQSVKEQPFDFDQYKSRFYSAIEVAQNYLNMCSLLLDFKNVDSKIKDFERYSRINIQPLQSEYIKTNNRIVGVLSNISKMNGVSKELGESLRGFAAYCKRIGGFNADMAGSYLEEAADYIYACLSEVKYVKTKEIWGGKSYKVHSPLLNRIVFPEYIVKFAYFSSSSSLSAISLYNRNMELISSVSSTGGALARGLAFCDKNGKKTSGIEFNYYEKSDFPVWKETGVDLWGYPYAEDEDEECTDYEIYATLNSLKNIVLSDGGKIEVKYERNYGRKGIVGGIRLKSLVFSNELNGRSDTISYGYPRVGVSVYKPLSNVVSISYPECTDWIEYSRVIQEGYPVINMGNNGLYYSCVTETISGRGSTVYSYQVSPPTSVNESDYPYWENGLLREKAVYDTNGEMLKKIQYIYETDVNYEDKLPQMQPSDFYLDGKSLESFYRNQGTSYLTGKEIYEYNIKPRLSLTNTDKFYNLQYGWRTALKEEVEYRSDENIPYSRTKYYYDNPMSMYPTCVIRIGSDGIERTEVLKRAMDMADTADSVFVMMKEANFLSPVVKSLILVDEKLVHETVCRYQVDRESKIGFIAPVEVLTYVPDMPEAYAQSVVDTILFSHGESNYTTEASYRYASKMWVETNGRTERKSRVYDSYGKLLLECDVIGTTASDKYKGVGKAIDEADLKFAINYLRKQQRTFASGIEVLKEEVDNQHFLRFLNSQDHSFIASFAEEIVKSKPDLSQARYYYEHIVCYDLFNVFKQEYERMIGLYPKFEILRQFISAMEAMMQFDGLSLFDYLYGLYGEVDKYKFAYLPKLTPASGMKNLRLYILDGNATASGSITHAGSEVPYTVESVSSSKLKIYDIDLSKYTDITSVTANTQGSYMALVPEGANFKATSYNPDGTVYARFDQSGNVEYYTYDAAGRVIKVEDQYGNILKTYEYNKLNN